jgi:hypothetical protein
MSATEYVYTAILLLREAYDASYVEHDERLMNAMELLWAAIDEIGDDDFHVETWR